MDHCPIRPGHRSNGTSRCTSRGRRSGTRERLLEQGDEALAGLLVVPDADRQLIRKVRLERGKQRPPRACRELFRTLKALMAESDEGAEAAESDDAGTQIPDASIDEDDHASA